MVNNSEIPPGYVLTTALRDHPPGSWPHPGSPEPLTLGVPAPETHSQLQQDVVAELANKLAWVLGSVYRMPYSNQRTLARKVAWILMGEIITEQGYPYKIAKR